MVENTQTNFYVELNNGIKMPRLGLGTALVQDVANIAYHSIKDGVRLIDTAWFYKNEKEVGVGVKKAIDEGIVKREDLFIVTKVWPCFKDNPEACLQESLTKLGLDYVDLLLDHWPYNFYYDKETGKEVGPVPLHVFWPMMEELVTKGLTRSIGVSNYNVQLLSDLLSFAKIKPVVNQFELHPYLSQRELVKYCTTNKVYAMAYFSITRAGSLKKGPGTEPLNLLEDPVFKTYAEKYGVSAGILALSWALSQEAIVIPSTSNPDRMKGNLNALNLKISKEDLDELHDKLNINFRLCDPKNPEWVHMTEWTKGVDIFA
jgi:D-xylose reductase